ncbi:P-loop containing nucleoside triphosphate hydrolase protein [Camillea tinctor]|nr:P-loop containing nucleoside triphosphate hydrolase protein [Camillea tinctor]
MDTIKGLLTLALNYLQRMTISRLIKQSQLYNYPLQHLPDNTYDAQGNIQGQKYSSDRASSPLIVFILGPPGAGKGTQSAALCDKFSGLTHLSYGDLLRYHESIPGDWVTTFPKRHGREGNRMLPADEAVDLLRQTIGKGKKGQDTWLVDGFPRNEKHVIAWLKVYPPAQCVFYLNCDRDVLLKRIHKRAADGSGRAEDRDDNKAKERVDRSLRESREMLDVLRAHGTRIIEIDANRGVELVENELSTHFQVSWGFIRYALFVSVITYELQR